MLLIFTESFFETPKSFFEQTFWVLKKTEAYSGRKTEAARRRGGVFRPQSQSGEAARRRIQAAEPKRRGGIRAAKKPPDWVASSSKLLFDYA